uniref:Dickkopf WNT signaling pathway inhibitor 3b n=1 Tax=Paramormyrops kingsleyae TaxID=1676925 RepID=A0A3B3QSM0_9TELE
MLYPTIIRSLRNSILYSFLLKRALRCQPGIWVRWVCCIGLPEPSVRADSPQECRVDEDCGTDCYCLYKMLRSQCLPCKTAQATCTKDEECCGAQLCVWGQCTENATKGTAGSICQYQSNCSAELCCAYHEVSGEHCHTHSNHLVAQLNWISAGEGPLDQCPCAAGLWCQSLMAFREGGVFSNPSCKVPSFDGLHQVKSKFNLYGVFHRHHKEQCMMERPNNIIKLIKQSYINSYINLYFIYSHGQTFWL